MSPDTHLEREKRIAPWILHKSEVGCIPMANLEGFEWTARDEKSWSCHLRTGKDHMGSWHKYLAEQYLETPTLVAAGLSIIWFEVGGQPFSGH